MVFLAGCTILHKTDDDGIYSASDRVAERNVSKAKKDAESSDEQTDTEQSQSPSAKDDEGDLSKEGNCVVVVLDPGHGKSSSLMTDEEKRAYGYTLIGGGWGEWRHFKSGTMWQDCEGTGCSGRVPSGGSCWYPIGHGDRDTEPDINYNNAVNAKKYLEELGYTVRITRSQNENPSLTQRLRYCYPDLDISKQPDASAYVCLHSNAGGGSGSCYISLSGLYDQLGKGENYIEAGNELGKIINDSIVQNTSLSACGIGRYDGYPELVLFCKSPVPVAYMEIGFYDNENDLGILQNESENIGKAIAEGVDSYFKSRA